MNPNTPHRAEEQAGFSLIETMVALVFAAFALLGFAHAFTASYLHVVREGESTMGLAAARQVLEDVKMLDLADLDELNGFDSTNVETLPQDQPQRNVARRLRYAVGGTDGSWSVTEAERARWARTEGEGHSPDGRATITVESPSATLRRVVVSVWMPGRDTPVTLETRLTDL